MSNNGLPLTILGLVLGFLIGFVVGREYQRREFPQLRIDVPGMKIEQK